MKRILLITLALVLATVSWSAPMKLIWMATGPMWLNEEHTPVGGFENMDQKLVAAFMKANPGVEVQIQFRDVTQGMLTFQTLLAAGTPPDVWIEASGNANPYLHDAYAMDMKQYLTKAELAQYKPESIGPYIRNGNVYALPQSQIAGGFAVNLDMLAKIGEKMPDQAKWTTDEFLRIARKLKGAGIPATMIMIKNGLSGWNYQWLYAFGGSLYNGKNYGVSAINSPANVKAFKYMKQLVDEGLVQPFPEEQDENSGVELFTTGKVFSCAMQNGHTDYWVPEQVKQGKLDKEFNMTFVEFPHGPGKAHVETFGYQAIVVSHRSANETRNKMVAKLALVAAGKDYVGQNCIMNGGFSTIIGLEPKTGKAAKPSYAAIAALAKVAGLMDTDPFGPRSGESRAGWKDPVQAFFRGEITAEAALKQMEESANEVLAR
ncbi:MAG: extracellular solute-binding protein [Candidatus Omnitrophica bacterium]|nr:extracellular solute-binding protein [Candidatus Omnitrophota bacterium]